MGRARGLQLVLVLLLSSLSVELVQSLLADRALNCFKMFRSLHHFSSLPTRSRRDQVRRFLGSASNSTHGTFTSKYANLLAQLYQINMYNPVKMGLDNMLALDNHFKNPIRGIPVIHVGGTNGKGSVSYKISRALSASGLKTGLFVSPHISSFKERVQVDQQLLTDEDVETMLPAIFDACKQNNIPATFFEITTMLAFLKFQSAKCDAIVLEVGLGGRLDATNVITPVLSIITSIQFDHVKILGDTLEKIAYEKAGIIKPHRAVLVGPDLPMAVIKSRVDEVQAKLFRISDILTHDATPKQYQDTDELNTDLSKAALQIMSDNLCNINGSAYDILQQRLKSSMDSDAIKAALSSRPPCRYENFILRHKHGGSKKTIRVILDIAHNIDAMNALVKRTKKYFPGNSIR